MKFEKMLIFHHQKSAKNAVDEHISQNYFFKEITLEDIKKYPIFQMKDRLLRYLKNMDQNFKAFGLFEKQNEYLVCYAWTHLLVNNEPWTYIWDCRTDEKFQGQGLYRNLLRKIADLCNGQNILKITIACHSGNEASIKGIEAAGFELKRKIFRLRILKKAIIFQSFFNYKIVPGNKIYFFD